jgi:hypothetical protein
LKLGTSSACETTACVLLELVSMGRRSSPSSSAGAGE